MEKTKGFIAEFKEFISRGNVMDMAVGIIVGTAFTAIVTSLVNGIIMPFIGFIIGGLNFEDYKFVLAAATETTPEVAILYGSFIQQVINFLIIAFVVFLMIKVLNGIKNKAETLITKEEKGAAEDEDPAPTEAELLAEIRDLLKSQTESQS